MIHIDEAFHKIIRFSLKIAAFFIVCIEGIDSDQKILRVCRDTAGRITKKLACKLGDFCS